jgi:hypothetical protein
MEKIQEQAGEIDKEQEKCQNVRREFKGAEEEHNRRFTILEHEMEQLKTSKKILETLAPGDIFRGRTTTSSANPCMKFDPDTKRGSTYVPDALKHTTRSTNEPLSEKAKGEQVIDIGTTAQFHLICPSSLEKVNGNHIICSLTKLPTSTTGINNRDWID